jgi:glutamyl-tRNA reductase
MTGAAAVEHAIYEKLKNFNYQIPKEVIKKIVVQVKSQYEDDGKEEKTEIYEKVKELTNSLASGMSNEEFFKIVLSLAGKYLEDPGN